MMPNEIKMKLQVDTREFEARLRHLKQEAQGLKRDVWWLTYRRWAYLALGIALGLTASALLNHLTN